MSFRPPHPATTPSAPDEHFPCAESSRPASADPATCCREDSLHTTPAPDHKTRAPLPDCRKTNCTASIPATDGHSRAADGAGYASPDHSHLDLTRVRGGHGFPDR